MMTASTYCPHLGACPLQTPSPQCALNPNWGPDPNPFATNCSLNADHSPHAALSTLPKSILILTHVSDRMI